MVFKSLKKMEVAQRRIERESRTQQRALERKQKEMDKMEELARANYEFEVYENLIAVFTSIHKDCGHYWNWEEISLSNPPVEPKKSDLHEKEALNNLNNYEPGISDKLFRRGENKRKELEKAVVLASEEDNHEYLESIEVYKQELVNWELVHDLAIRILNKDNEAYMEAISNVGSLEEISELGSRVQFKIDEFNLIESELNIHDAKVIPTEEKTILNSGKLSIKPMPKTRYYGLYQDYVCSCAIRVAREIFALLPTELVIVTIIGEILNTKTGHLEDMPILSVAFPKVSLGKLNFDMLDPSDAMDNFVHNMKFIKTKGFNPVDKLDKYQFVNNL